MNGRSRVRHGVHAVFRKDEPNHMMQEQFRMLRQAEIEMEDLVLVAVVGREREEHKIQD